MHLQVKLSATIAVVLTMCACAGARAGAQDSGTQGSSSSSQQPTGEQNQGPATQYGVYQVADPLARVRYDNRYDMSLGFAYDHMKAGPNLLEGSNLGGLDMEGSYWLRRNWGIEATGRGYIGTSGAAPNVELASDGSLVVIRGPVVKQYFFVGGAEWLGPHNKHGALIAHAMFGGVYGNFQKDLRGEAPEVVGFYYNQIAPAGIIGGHFDLNRNEHWVFRITPDAVMTHYTFSDEPNSSLRYAQYDVNFAISVGLEYKFTSIKRSSNKKINWKSGW